MTTRNQELYDRFQLYYNNVESNAAPGLTVFEISMYLTKAQRELVDSLYSEYEKSEATRKALAPLVDSYSAEPAGGGTIERDSKLFAMPADVLYVVYEALTYPGRGGACEPYITAEVVPVTHDEYHRVRRNPFRYNKRRALRLDTGEGGGVQAEIVAKSGTSYTRYYMRYVRRPRPIVLDDLDGQTIDGYGTAMEPELDMNYDDALAQAAAQSAHQDYKQ